MELNLYTILLIFIRLTVFFSISKVFFIRGSGNAVKVGFAFILAYIISLNIQPINNSSDIHFLIAVLNETITGAILALMTNIAFEILSIIGSWLDTHMGLSMGAMYDPNFEAQVTVNAKLVHYAGLVIFLASDGYKILITSLIYSFRAVSIGKSIMNVQNIELFIQTIINYFFIAIRISFPLVLVILLTELCLGLISRAVPAINVMILGAPVKIFVGLIVLLIGLPVVMKFFMSVVSNIPEIIERISLIISDGFATVPGSLTFAFAMAPGEKTEEATPKKKLDVRKKGQVAKTKEVSQALTLIVTIFIIILLSGTIIKAFSNNIIYYINSLGNLEAMEIVINSVKTNVTLEILKIILIITVPLMITGVLGHVVQTGFMSSLEQIKPKLSKLNPINGFKNIFSLKNLTTLFKNIIIVIIVTVIGYQYIKDNLYKILNLINAQYPYIGADIKNLIVGILVKIVILAVVLALLDYIIQYRLFKKEIMMTKQEVKDEFKDLEGDPNIKATIKRRQKEILQKSIMTKVKDATVVIVNPTHFAVALKYVVGEMNAPVVVAKGQDHIALRIKEIAKENKVTIIENKPLARELYAKVDLGDEIPEELYQAVIEVLKVVYKLNKGI